MAAQSPPATPDVGYLLVFGLFTLQDRFSGPQAVPYTEFKSQVANKNVAELFARGDSIEGQLRKAAALPGQQDRTYQQFTTERPTFATGEARTRATSSLNLIKGGNECTELVSMGACSE